MICENCQETIVGIVVTNRWCFPCYWQSYHSTTNFINCPKCEGVGFVSQFTGKTPKAKAKIEPAPCKKCEQTGQILKIRNITKEMYDAPEWAFDDSPTLTRFIQNR